MRRRSAHAAKLRCKLRWGQQLLLLSLPLFTAPHDNSLPGSSSICRVDAWGPWSGCSVTCGRGTSVRKRTIVAAPKGGGQCPYLSEERPCMTHQCAVSNDKDVIFRTGQGGWQEMRTPKGQMYYFNHLTKRTKATKPDNFGVGLAPQVPTPKSAPTQFGPCQLSPWGPWGACTFTCGTGTRISRRHVVNKEAAKRCQGKVRLMRMRYCHPPPCKHAACAWSDWSACSRSCGAEGFKERRKNIDNSTHKRLPPSVCPINSFTRQEQSCNGDIKCPLDCDLGSWGDWGPCSAEGFEQLRWASIDGHYFSDGSPSSADMRHIKAATCGSAWRVRTRPLLSVARWGGRACSSRAQKLECVLGPCPIDCALSRWGKWTACSITCGTNGVRSRQRFVTKLQTNGGTCAHKLRETKRCVGKFPDCFETGKVGEWVKETEGWSNVSDSKHAKRPHGQHYYYHNILTGANSWAMPPDYLSQTLHFSAGLDAQRARVKGSSTGAGAGSMMNDDEIGKPTLQRLRAPTAGAGGTAAGAGAGAGAASNHGGPDQGAFAVPQLRPGACRNGVIFLAPTSAPTAIAHSKANASGTNGTNRGTSSVTMSVSGADRAIHAAAAAGSKRLLVYKRESGKRLYDGAPLFLRAPFSSSSPRLRYLFYAAEYGVWAVGAVIGQPPFTMTMGASGSASANAKVGDSKDGIGNGNGNASLWLLTKLTDAELQKAHSGAIRPGDVLKPLTHSSDGPVALSNSAAGAGQGGLTLACATSALLHRHAPATGRGGGGTSGGAVDEAEEAKEARAELRAGARYWRRAYEERSRERQSEAAAATASGARADRARTEVKSFADCRWVAIRHHGASLAEDLSSASLSASARDQMRQADSTAAYVYAGVYERVQEGGGSATAAGYGHARAHPHSYAFEKRDIPGFPTVGLDAKAEAEARAVWAQSRDKGGRRRQRRRQRRRRRRLEETGADVRSSDGRERASVSGRGHGSRSKGGSGSRSSTTQSPRLFLYYLRSQQLWMVGPHVGDFDLGADRLHLGAESEPTSASDAASSSSFVPPLPPTQGWRLFTGERQSHTGLEAVCSEQPPRVQHDDEDDSASAAAAPAPAPEPEPAHGTALQLGDGSHSQGIHGAGSAASAASAGGGDDDAGSNGAPVTAAAKKKMATKGFELQLEVKLMLLGPHHTHAGHPEGNVDQQAKQAKRAKQTNMPQSTTEANKAERAQAWREVRAAIATLCEVPSQAVQLVQLMNEHTLLVVDALVRVRAERSSGGDGSSDSSSLLRLLAAVQTPDFVQSFRRRLQQQLEQQSLQPQQLRQLRLDVGSDAVWVSQPLPLHRSSSNSQRMAMTTHTGSSWKKAASSTPKRRLLVGGACALGASALLVLVLVLARHLGGAGRGAAGTATGAPLQESAYQRAMRRRLEEQRAADEGLELQSGRYT